LFCFGLNGAGITEVAAIPGDRRLYKDKTNRI
jgi:hypothetical protein